MASISDLYLNQARRAADAIRQRGDASAQHWQNVGTIVGQTAQNIGQYYADAPRRELQEQQLTQGRNDVAAQQAEARIAEGLRSAKTPEDILEVAGPERGAKIIAGLDALHAAHTKQFADTQQVIADTLAGMDATPEPMRAELYPTIRKTLLDAGVITAKDAPEQYDSGWFQQARNFGRAPEKPADPKVIGQGDVLVGPDGKALFTNPKPVAEKPEEGAYVTVKGPGGRPVRQWVPKTKLETGVEEYREPQAPRAPEPLESVIGPNGQPILVPRSQAVGKMPATSREKPTEDERKTAGFYSQMRDAITTIDELEDQVTEKELYQIQTLPQDALIGLVNRGQMSEAAKRYLRAFEQFTESRLRPVSGAAINDAEYARDRRTYAKQYGETPKLKEDRSRARNLALDSLGKRAGVLKPKDEEPPPPQVLAAGPGEHTFANGQTWKVSADGKSAQRIK